LQSDLWRTIRENAFCKLGRTCRLCGGIATQIHHRRYHRNELLRGRTKFLVPICMRCHESVEFDSNGNKLRLAQSAQKTLLLAVRHKTLDASLKKSKAPQSPGPSHVQNVRASLAQNGIARALLTRASHLRNGGADAGSNTTLTDLG
jgi:hypothetical protein